MTTLNIFQIASILLSGLLAGLFYGYDCSVINGLGNLPDKEYLNSFQVINKAIINPYFFVSFIGNLFMLPITAWLTYKGSTTSSFVLILIATLLYVIGVFGITIIGNVPLNNMLANFDLTLASDEAIQNFRQTFENKWNTLHHIRTYASILAFLLTIISLIKK